jgi:uncharacterized damage-inducible protein DinB
VSSLALIRDLFRHMEWADALIWSAVTGPIAGAPDSRLRDSLFHIHLTQRAFLQIWMGGPLPPFTPESFPTLADIRAWARSYFREVTAYLDSLDESRLATPLTVPWSQRLEQRLGRQPAPATLGDTLLQVPSHSTYHRGQVNRQLRELGVEPPLVDYIVWVWLGRPAPAWATA